MKILPKDFTRTSDKVKNIHNEYFPPGKYFYKVKNCDLCKSPIGFRTDGYDLFKDTNCNCNAILQPVKRITWNDLDKYHNYDIF